MRFFFFILLGLGLMVGCGGSASQDDGGTDASDDGGDDGGPLGPPEKLSEWALFEDAPAQEPAAGVIPYEMISPLFTDFAAKHRFLYVPDGEVIDYDDTAKWAFPVGSILIKTFAYPVDERNPGLGERLIETRLLVHEEDGWTPHTYVWNEDQTEALRETEGDVVSVSYIDAEGETVDIESYAIPSNEDCRSCHGSIPDTSTLGPKTAQLNRMNDYGSGDVNQIDHIQSLGLFDSAPPAAEERLTFPDPDGDAPVADRARAYMDSNCGSCHSPTGVEALKQLYIDWQSTDPVTGTDPFNWGVCKEPSSQANINACEELWDVVPGSPEDSLMICRMELTEDGQMPSVGRSLVHENGVALVSAWIAQLEPDTCDE